MTLDKARALTRGARLHMTPKAAKWVQSGSYQGTLWSVARSGLLRVIRDNQKTPGSWHPDFWEPCECESHDLPPRRREPRARGAEIYAEFLRLYDGDGSPHSERAERWRALAAKIRKLEGK